MLKVEKMSFVHDFEREFSLKNCCDLKEKINHFEIFLLKKIFNTRHTINKTKEIKERSFVEQLDILPKEDATLNG